MYLKKYTTMNLLKKMSRNGRHYIVLLHSLFAGHRRETTNVTINIKDEARFDFLSITRWKDGNISYFNPSLRFQLNSISEDIAKGKYSKGSYIFETSIESESFLKSETYLIKFVWGGCWEYDPTYMDAMCSIELLDKNDISELGM